MGRKLLFITTDQMRYDALGCNGGRIARTPTLDALAADGLNYRRAHNQNVVCMPARATMLTGQYVRTHGVFMNGVALPVDAPSVAAELHAAGYHTALFGKAHFEPHIDFQRQFYENTMANDGEFGPHRGFEHLELATHSPTILHYGAWMREHHPADIGGFYPNLTRELRVNNAGGGDTGAIQVHPNPVARERYHTDWVADRTLGWLASRPPGEPWFCWMSFPDPHHPWDPPASEAGRVRWRELDVPAGYPGSAAAAGEILSSRPHHWLDYFAGQRVSNMEAPPRFTPAALTTDQLREIDALIHVENELIDEACGRVLERVTERGWAADTDVIFTSDHGEEFMEHGKLLHSFTLYDEVLRVPLVLRGPGIPAGLEVDEQVGLLDLTASLLTWSGADASRLAGTPLTPLLLAEGRSRPVLSVRDDKYLAYRTPERKLIVSYIPYADPAVSWFPHLSLIAMSRIALAGEHRNKIGWFHLDEDPGEQHDRLPSGARDARRLYSELRELVARHPTPAVSPGLPEPGFSDDIERTLRALGYVD